MNKTDKKILDYIERAESIFIDEWDIVPEDYQNLQRWRQLILKIAEMIQTEEIYKK